MLRRRLTRLCLFIGLMLAAILSMPWTGNLKGMALGRWAVLFFGSLWITTILHSVAARTTRRPLHHRIQLRRHGDKPATVIGYRWWSPWSLFGVSTAFAVSFLLLPTVIGLIAPDFGWVVYRNREVIGLISYAVILTSPYTLGYLTRGRHRPGLTLDRTGIQHRTWFVQRYHRWDTIDDIELSNHPSGIIVTITPAFTRAQRTEGDTDANQKSHRRHSNRAGGLAVNPRTVQAVITHYLHHPGDRDELGQPSSAGRMTE